MTRKAQVLVWNTRDIIGKHLRGFQEIGREKLSLCFALSCQESALIRDSSLRGSTVNEGPGFGKQRIDVTISSQLSGNNNHVRAALCTKNPVLSLAAELGTCWRSRSRSFRPTMKVFYAEKFVVTKLKHLSLIY